ncbi:MAG: prepilin peptidase-dependent protein [Candidatus Schmidhempelia sp.]|nr:prepilin peptidase-dependent protein [Candidatus Schmidhempelia sp.]
MLKQQGFSLFEMAIVLALSSILMIAIMQFFPTFQRQWLFIYQKQRIMHILNNAILPLYKDIKRAGFIAKINIPTIGDAIQISSNGNCIIIHYDLNRIGKWTIDAKDLSKIDTFAYRYAKNNVEYLAGAKNCESMGWEKLFDNKEINITQFHLSDHQSYLEIKMSGFLISDPDIVYSLTRMISYENR